MNLFSSSLITLIAFYASISSFELSHEELNLLPPLHDSYMFTEPLPSGLTEVISHLGPRLKIAIEVGSYIGASSMFIAQSIPEHSKLICIDSWLWDGPKEHKLFNNYDDVYLQFLSNIFHSNLANKISSLRMSSTSAAKFINVKADLIFIDAQHDYQAVKSDLEAWLPHLTVDGIMCGDDYNFDSVKKAVDEKAKQYNKKLIVKGGRFWIFLND